VDDIPITRDELVQRCLTKYGAKELDVLINTLIIRRECDRHRITVSAKELVAEAERIAIGMGLTPDTWYGQLQTERGWSKDAYLRDIVQPNLMAEKLRVAGSFTSLDELKRKSRIEVYFGEPRANSVKNASADAGSQQDRLSVLERKLDETIESLKSLKRELK
jgi:hypothetical protein